MRAVALGLVVVLTLAIPAVAFDGRSSALSLDAKAVVFPQLQANYDSAKVAEYLQSPAWQAWNSAHGGNWTAQYDTLTGKPRRVYGGALPWSGDLETSARTFIASNGALFATTNDRLRFVPQASAADPRVRFASFDYVIDGVPVESARVVFAVNNGRMIYWNSTNIAAVPAVTTPALSADAAQSALLSYAGVAASDVEVRQAPQLKLLPKNTTAGAMLAYQLVYESVFETADHAVWAGHVDALTGSVVAFGDTNRYACPQNPVGRVSGGIRPAEATDEEVVRSFPLVRVDDRTGAIGSSQNGTFSWGAGSVSTSISGTYFDTNCVDCVKSKSEPAEGWQAFTSGVTGFLELGSGGGDEITPAKTISFGNGTSTPAERTAFFHTNVARLMALKWLVLPWLQTNVPVNVNINDSCNAFWNGVSTNFFKKGVSGTVTCNNTGEIRDVMQHEWGHGLDSNDGLQPGLVAGLGDFATGEAVGDHVALFVDHDSCIGQSFANPRNTGPFLLNPDDPSYPVRNCNGVRNTDELRANRGKLSTSNVHQKCATATANAVLALVPYYIGPLVAQGHCEGEIWGQTAWHLQQSLMSGRRYGTVVLDSAKRAPTYAGDPLPSGADGSTNAAIDRHRAWTIHERLFYASRPIVATYAPSHLQAIGPSAYDGYMVVDDEGDGLANGTPHAAYINDAFSDHGITELVTMSDVANCAPLATPSVSAAQGLDSASGMPAITLSWSPVAGAAGYNVLRTERANDVFLPVAVAGAGTTSVTDAGVDNGVTYIYRVEAFTSTGCYTGSSAGTVTATAAQPALRFRNATVDDAFGDGDGALDAGERSYLYVAIENFGLAALSNAQVTLTSRTAGVNVTHGGPYSYGTIAAGAVAGPSKLFRISLDKNPALCGTSADFVLTITGAEGCITTAFSLPIGNDGTACVVFNGANARPASVAVTSDQAGLCGDGDNYPDAGETIEVTVVVENSGTRTAQNVDVTLAVDKPYITFVGPSTINVGSVAGSYTETKTAVFRLAVGSGPFDDRVTFTATVGSNQMSAATFANRDKSLATQRFDFESGEQGWSATGAEQNWTRTLAPQTGNVSTVFYSQYFDAMCPLLVSPSVEFSNASALSFDLAYVSEDTDAPWDGIDVQVNAGGKWIKLYPVQGYSTPVHAGSGCIPGDTPMFSGYSPVMTRYTAPIPAELAGSIGQVRFRWSADALVSAPLVGGAWVDNVALENVAVSVPDLTCP